MVNDKRFPLTAKDGQNSFQATSEIRPGHRDLQKNDTYKIVSTGTGVCSVLAGSEDDVDARGVDCHQANATGGFHEIRIYRSRCGRAEPELRDADLLVEIRAVGMTPNIIDQVALALFASDGMKIASPGTTVQQSWDRTPEKHVVYRERALVFLKVLGEQMSELADAEIARLGEKDRQ